MRAALLTTTALAATLLASCSDPAGPEARPVPSVTTTAPTAPATPTPTSATPKPTESTPAPAETPAPTPTAAPEGCSSEGVAYPEQPGGLPSLVGETWLNIVDAAADCDFDELARIATPRTTFSYGGGGIEVVERAEEHGDGDLATLVRVMGLSHRTVDGTNGRYVVWPAASARASWAETPRAERRELRAIHSAEEIASFAEYGHYLGWRVGIAADGSWMYYVAGD